jgi:hypothetical protein
MLPFLVRPLKAKVDSQSSEHGVIDNVRFINYVFVMKYTPPAEQFADLILNQNVMTGILS